MFKQWRVKFKLLVLSFTQRLVVADNVAFQIPPLLKHKRYAQDNAQFQNTFDILAISKLSLRLTWTQ
jgi:hypothetical protein